MYISLQFIILEILLGLVFLVVLYFMLRELLKKLLRKELETIKEPIDILANYLVGKAQMEAAEDELVNEGQDQQQLPPGQDPPKGGTQMPNHAGQKRVAVEPSPEKLPLEPVDVADEFVALKNANRINAYNLRVQKIWELYKAKKINIKQYNEELVRLKKEFNIEMGSDNPDEANGPKKMAPVKKLKAQPAEAPAKENNPEPPENTGADPVPDSEKDPDAGTTGASSQEKVARKPEDTDTHG